MSINKKKIIGVDLDEVLMDALTPTCRLVNEHRGTSITRDQVKYHDFSKVWECALDEIRPLLDIFYNSPLHDEGLPMPQAQEVIAELKDGYKLHIITARPESAKEKTLEWLEQHFPNTFENVHFTEDYWNKGNTKKGEICRELGVHIFIDDAPHNIESVAPVVEDAFLMHSPWNEDYTPEHINVHRVHSWGDIREMLKEQDV